MGPQDETSALIKVDTGCLSPHQVRAGKARRRPLQATESPAGPERAVPCLAWPGRPLCSWEKPLCAGGLGPAGYRSRG